MGTCGQKVSKDPYSDGIPATEYGQAFWTANPRYPGTSSGYTPSYSYDRFLRYARLIAEQMLRLPSENFELLGLIHLALVLVLPCKLYWIYLEY